MSQITSLNYTTNTRAVLQIHGLEKVSFATTDWPLPGLSLNSTRQPTPFTDFPIRGDKLQFKPLNINFIVTSRLENWKELYDWFVGLSAPRKFDEFCQKPMEYTDATLHLYTGKQNKFAEVLFTNLVPVDLGDIQFNTQAESTEETFCSATFEYQSYNIKFTSDMHKEMEYSDHPLIE